MEEEKTQIQISIITRKLLLDLGKKGETYNQVIKRIIKEKNENTEI